MPYIRRDEKGKIVEIHNSPIDREMEWTETNSSELITFLKQIETTDQAKNALTSSDGEMLRVVEDVIDLLMKKQIFIFTELPEAVQVKLNERRQLRKDMNSLEGLIDEDDAIF